MSIRKVSFLLTLTALILLFSHFKLHPRMAFIRRLTGTDLMEKHILFMTNILVKLNFFQINRKQKMNLCTLKIQALEQEWIIIRLTGVSRTRVRADGRSSISDQISRADLTNMAIWILYRLQTMAATQFLVTSVNFRMLMTDF